MYKLMFSDRNNRECYGSYETLAELKAAWEVTFADMKDYYHEPPTTEGRDAWWPVNQVRLYVVE